MKIDELVEKEETEKLNDTCASYESEDDGNGLQAKNRSLETSVADRFHA